MKAKVTVGGRESDLFDVLVGVKQECVLAPVIFNLFQLPLHWRVVMVFAPMLEFHIPNVWMAISLTCVD